MPDKDYHQENNHSKYCECLKCFTEEPPQPKWEEEFDKKFVPANIRAYCDRIDIETLGMPMVIKDIKSFISSLLSSHIPLEEVVGLMTRMRARMSHTGEAIITTAVYVSPAQQMRNAADQIEADERLKEEVDQLLSSLKQKLLDKKK